jgi:DNA replication protein DnaC
MSAIKTLTRLRDLKLGGMAAALEHQQNQPGTYDELSFTERLELLLDRECQTREQHRRNLKKAQVAQLAQTDWLVRGQNLLITGPCGSGKTYLGCAIGHQACLNGLSARYYRISRLMLELTQAKADGTYQKTLNQLSKINLLILDDWGLEALSPAHRNDLMEIMDDRHGAQSTLIISQLPTDQWYAAIGDNTLADAILDRLMHNAHRWALNGESMRKQLQEID